MRPVPPIELLTHVAQLLGDLCHEVVFLGGAVVGLLLVEQGGRPPRVTRDVDVAIQLSGQLMDVYELDRRLLSLGFKNDVLGPVCRYLHGAAIVDVIPVHPPVLGDVNGWYPLAIETAKPHMLGSGIQIKVIDPVCFLATKLVAFRSPTREHHDDIFLSRDFDDMMRVIDGRPAIVEEVLHARDDLRSFLQAEFGALGNERYLEDALSELVDPGREGLVLERLHGIAAA